MINSFDFQRWEKIRARCEHTFALCDEHIKYLQDNTDLKRIDEQIEEIKKQGAVLIKESEAYRAELKMIWEQSKEIDELTDKLLKKA
ncbi:MAG: hypothetical protein LBU80_02520 [Rikenellaceae bacterium]|jgi:hypothetical protein|nr:hypothetical protein [Rikenellaceae bacterium]